jgi:hypothetical protein
MDFRDRIVRLDRVPASQIENAPWNYRKHPESQISALRGSVEELGFFKPLDVYVTDEGMYRLIDGEARRNLIEADVSPDTLIPISVTDLSEAEAKKALLIADPLSALAEQDSAALESLMRDVQIADEALAAMVAGMAEDAGIIPPEQPLTRRSKPRIAAQNVGTGGAAELVLQQNRNLRDDDMACAWWSWFQASDAIRYRQIAVSDDSGNGSWKLFVLV